MNNHYFSSIRPFTVINFHFFPSYRFLPLFILLLFSAVRTMRSFFDLLAVSIILVGFSLADQIIWDEPAAHAVVHAGTPLNIQYRVHKNGMAHLNSAALSLVSDTTERVAMIFPEGLYNASNNSPSVQFVWRIPRDMARDNYTLRVAGPASYPCSKSGDGRAPFGQCKTVTEATRSFTIVES
ncbi:hypothetical protein BCR43DRAFT_322043 [Syncephalastrum racemosum]|uniref:Uncharacterized protein n=1 Tax=Syncephalastrum racemosum TaxID=13706 RepID=A0A1X2H7D9_SYNRA|nr:hypothetical protein BCR43DRAFT_322043 [Syncephalastrum racemosum]